MIKLHILNLKTKMDQLNSYELNNAMINEEIDDLNNHNVIFQAISRREVFITQPTHPYLQLVNSNTLENRITYFQSNNNIYSKGIERVNTWKTLFNSPQILSLYHTERYFVLSSLIILFQIYGDGNHRTASYLYNKHTGLTLNWSILDNFNIEYDILTSDCINNLIYKLVGLYRNTFYV